MLSSILQQEGDIPEITVSISHTDNDGTPTTKEVCDFFRGKGLNIEEIILTEEEVKNRAIARNKQVKECKSDWILFADSDMVYDKDFFADLKLQLSTNLKDEKRCMGADRISLDIPFCLEYFKNDTRIYPCVIENVADVVSKWPVKWIRGKGTAPGNFQLASIQAINEKGGKYSWKQKDLWRRTKADRMFRVIMGRIGINVKKQYHLNHDRDGQSTQR